MGIFLLPEEAPVVGVGVAVETIEPLAVDAGETVAEQRADLATKNAATCQTLFPNHSSKEFNSCLQNTLDPAFDSDQHMIAQQMNDSGKWWKVGLKIGLGVLIAAGAIACILIEPCGAVVAGALEVGGPLLEALAPVISADMYGLISATSTSLLFGGGAGLIGSGAAAAEIGIGASVEADLVDSAASESGAARQALSDAENGTPKLDPTSCANSFRGGTRVLLANGDAKRIDRIRVGDEVLATDPAAGRTLGEPVTYLHRNRDTALADVTVGSGAVLHTTQEHPFWDATTGQWADAADLRPGDVLRSSTMATAPQVAAVQTYTGHRVMYNLTVANLHTYYVFAGDTPVLVHNCDIPAGFAGKDEYNAFVNTLNGGLSGAGFDGAEAAFQGSSVTGKSFASGQPFGAHSDYDIALGGQDLFDRARELGIPLRSGGTRTGPLKPTQLDALGLSGMRAQLQSMAGRPVNFMIYDSIEGAMARSASLPALPCACG